MPASQPTTPRAKAEHDGDVVLAAALDVSGSPPAMRLPSQCPKSVADDGADNGPPQMRAAATPSGVLSPGCGGAEPPRGSRAPRFGHVNAMAQSPLSSEVV